MAMPSRVLLALLLTITAGQAQPADVPESARLAALSRSLAAGDAKAVETFWREVERVHTPLIEPAPDSPEHMLVTFLWRARLGEESVNVGVSEVGIDDAPETTARALQRLAASDVWFRTYRISARQPIGVLLSNYRWIRCSNPSAKVTCRHLWRHRTPTR